MSETMAHYLRAIWEKRVRDFVRDRKANPSLRSIRVEFDVDRAAAGRHGASLRNVIARDYLQLEHVRENQGIERRPRPSLINSARHDVASSIRDRLNRIATLCERDY
jgi:hypothetical protein